MKIECSLCGAKYLGRERPVGPPLPLCEKCTAEVAYETGIGQGSDRK